MIVHITVHTAKLQESLEFYQWLLQLPIARRLSRPSGDILFLGDNETKFELIGDPEAEKINAKGITIGFLVDNLDEKLAMLEAKQIPYSKITTPSPDSRFAFFTDLNGCHIQLYEQKA